MALKILAQEKVWLDKARYVDAECMFHEKLSKELSGNFHSKETDIGVRNSYSESYDNIVLNSRHRKQSQRYTKYFKHKMNILKLLKQYKDYTMKTLSYYCNVCDFLTEEKYDWDSHNITEHSSATDRPIVHCSTCSMIVVGGSYEEHVSTKEHDILLKFVQSFEAVEDDSMKNTELIKLDDNSTSSTLDKTFINSEKSKHLNLNKFDNTETDTLDCENSENNCFKNNICTVKKNSNTKSKDHLIISNTLLLDKSNDTNKHKSNEAVKHIPNETALEHNISSNISPITTLCQQNEDMDMKKILNFFDVSTSTDDLNVLNLDGIETPGKIIERKSEHDVKLPCGETTLSLDSVTKLKNEKAGKFDEDELYGKYVTQRLKSITNSKVKQDLLLEIDYFFFVKTKQFQQKNT